MTEEEEKFEVGDYVHLKNPDLATNSNLMTMCVYLDWDGLKPLRIEEIIDTEEYLQAKLVWPDDEGMAELELPLTVLTHASKDAAESIPLPGEKQQASTKPTVH